MYELLKTLETSELLQEVKKSYERFMTSKYKDVRQFWLHRLAIGQLILEERK